MDNYIVQITGMTCDHCARTVEDTSNALAGVKARVSYPRGIAEIQASEDLSTEQLLQVGRPRALVQTSWGVSHEATDSAQWKGSHRNVDPAHHRHDL